jgi:myo-inositol-1(or 4)-monophosphatase
LPELDDLTLLQHAAQRAGEIACSFWCADPKVWDKGDGAGPVTEADLAVNEMLHDVLTSARPDHGWLSEETKDTNARLKKLRTIIVDPIDGTRSFIAGEKNWSHSIAIAEGGEIIAAVVYLPLRDRMFTAQKSNGAALNGAPLCVSDHPSLEGATLLTAAHTLNAKHWPTGRPEFIHKSRSSLAYRMSLVAQGRHDAMLTLQNTWEWDVAAGTLLVTEAGGSVWDTSGYAPRFNKPTPAFDGLVAANPTLTQDILSHLHA